MDAKEKLAEKGIHFVEKGNKLYFPSAFPKHGVYYDPEKEFWTNNGLTFFGSIDDFILWFQAERT